MIIASAAKFETKPLQAEVAKCAADIDWVFCGVGVLAAAAAGQRMQALSRDQEVLFIGTCGTFGTFKKVELCRTKTIHWSPTCARAGLSYAVDKTPPLSLNSSACYDALPAAEVFCAPNVSLTNTLPSAAQEDMLRVENIEAYAFLSELCATAKTVDVLLAVTNAVGKDAHQQWLQYHTQAAKLTAEYVVQRRFMNCANSLPLSRSSTTHKQQY